MRRTGYRYLNLVTAVFVTCLITANIIAVKLIDVRGPLDVYYYNHLAEVERAPSPTMMPEDERLPFEALNLASVWNLPAVFVAEKGKPLTTPAPWLAGLPKSLPLPHRGRGPG